MPKRTDVIATCVGCSIDYYPRDWKDLAYVGRQKDPPGELELRNCGCGTTLAVYYDEEGKPGTHPEDMEQEGLRTEARGTFAVCPNCQEPRIACACQGG